MDRDSIAILDFGSQFTQLIARRLRELQVYSEILPPRTPASALKARGLRGIVLSGGPDSVFEKGAPRCDPKLFDLGIPVLGVCYGMQLMSHLLGGQVRRSGQREYGQATFEASNGALLLAGLPPRLRVWMSHGDDIQRPPKGFSTVGATETNPVAAMEDRQRRLFGLLFHPEVAHSEQGTAVLANFLDVCGCRRDWNAASFIEEAVGKVQAMVGPDGRVLCALSGGVDSAVAALLVGRAVGDRLTFLFVDNGLLRKDEAAQVRKRFAERLKLKVVFVDASRRFLDRLKGVADPERQRKVIGREFIAVFQDATRRMKKTGFLAQGTLYPDVIESTSVRGPSAVIKSHHNVGGLPKRLGFKLVEPLR
jgi:GMP synthase (glutamine-hydrolysing)